MIIDKLEDFNNIICGTIAMGVSMTTPQKMIERQNLKRKKQLAYNSQYSTEQHQTHTDEDRQYQFKEVFINKYPTIIQESHEGYSRGSQVFQIHKNVKQTQVIDNKYQSSHYKSKSQIMAKEMISEANIKIETKKQIQPAISIEMNQGLQKLSSNVHTISNKQCEFAQKQSIEKLTAFQNNEQKISQGGIKGVEQEKCKSIIKSYTSLHPSNHQLSPIQQERVSLTTSSLNILAPQNKVNSANTAFQPLKITNSFNSAENEPMLIKSNPIKKQLHLVASSSQAIINNFQKIKNKNNQNKRNQGKITQISRNSSKNSIKPHNQIKIENIPQIIPNGPPKMNQNNQQQVNGPQERQPVKKKVRLIPYNDLF